MVDLGAISCFALQSFVANPATKGFLLQSGLGLLPYQELNLFKINVITFDANSVIPAATKKSTFKIVLIK